MFDLETSIAQWRRQMLAAGIKTSALDELESHLREEIERQMKAEQSQPAAFEMAVEIVGRGRELGKEFKKAEPISARFTRLLGIACGTVAFLFLLWLFPFLFVNQTDWTAKALGLAAIATSVLAWKYNYKLLPAIPSQLARTVIGFLCCVGGVVGIQIFIKDAYPDLMAHPAGTDFPFSRLFMAFFWAWAAMACLASIGRGLEKAANDQQPVVNSH